MVRATGGPRPRTIAFYKPFDVLPSFTDPEGRPTLAGFIDVPGVYAAGRLDRDSEGLMILTSDGALAHRITDPAHKLPKVYLARSSAYPMKTALAQLRTGVVLGDTRTKPAGVRLLSDEPPLPARAVPIRFRKNVPTAWLEITLHEGMNRQVRRMTAAVGHPTLRSGARRDRSDSPGRFAARRMARAARSRACVSAQSGATLAT